MQWIWNKMMFKVVSKPSHTVIKVLFVVNSHYTWHLNTWLEEQCFPEAAAREMNGDVCITLSLRIFLSDLNASVDLCLFLGYGQK